MSEHSRRPDEVLNQPRTAILFEKNHDGKVPKTALRDLTLGHQYYRQHLERPKGIHYQRLRPGPFTMMCEREDVQLGKVTTVHALRAEDCAYPTTPLPELVKERLMVRDDPSKITSLASYMKLRRSIWLVEETEDGQFRCNCPLGIKGKFCIIYKSNQQCDQLNNMGLQRRSPPHPPPTHPTHRRARRREA